MVPKSAEITIYEPQNALILHQNYCSNKPFTNEKLCKLWIKKDVKNDNGSFVVN